MNCIKGEPSFTPAGVYRLGGAGRFVKPVYLPNNSRQPNPNETGYFVERANDITMVDIKFTSTNCYTSERGRYGTNN